MPDILVLSESSTFKQKVEEKIQSVPTDISSIRILSNREEKIDNLIYIIDYDVISDFEVWCSTVSESHVVFRNTIVCVTNHEQRESDVNGINGIKASEKVRLYELGIRLVVNVDEAPSLFIKKVNELLAKKSHRIALSFLNECVKNQFEKHKEEIQGRNDLLQMAVHDLRSPLSAMICYSELLMDGVLDNVSNVRGGPDDPLNTIRQNCQFLMDMVNDLLDSAKLEAGKKQLELQETTISPLIEKVLRSLDGLIRKKEIKVDVELEETSQLLVDPQKMERVLMNLLSNAIKFTKTGGCITIRCSERSRRVIFSVQDTGPGIVQEELGSIFEKFNVGNQSTITGKGHGLGLAITKSFVELHGGRIFVRSVRHKGSTFIVHLPVKSAKEDVKTSMLKKVAVLDLAEDLEFLKKKELFVGHEVVRFSSLKDFQKESALEQYDYIILNEKKGRGAFSKEFFLIHSKGRPLSASCFILSSSESTEVEKEVLEPLQIFLILKGRSEMKILGEIARYLSLDPNFLSTETPI